MRLTLGLALFCTAMVSSSAALAVEVCKAPGDAVTRFGARFTGTHARVDGMQRTDTLQHIDPVVPARYLRLRIVLEQASESSWQLILRDNDLRPLQVIGPADYAGGTRSIWSRRLMRQRLTDNGVATEDIKAVKLDLSSSGAFPKLTVQEYIAMPQGAKTPFYSIKGLQPEWDDLFTGATADSWKRRGDAVGMLVGGRQTNTWCCSGVVVQSEPRVLFLTNFHCGAPTPDLADSAFWSEDVCASTVVDFSWDADTTSREFSCAKVVSRDADRDLVVLELKSLGVDAPPPPPPLRLERLNDDTGLTVLHHPECRAKKITTGCTVVQGDIPGWRPGAGTSDFTHQCDTEAGSSGAPVFDSDGRLVGIHHLGFEKTADGQCDHRNKGVWLKEATDVLTRAGVPLPPN